VPLILHLISKNKIMGLPEILIIAVVLLVLFGAKRIPALMKGIGKGINDFNKEKNAKDDDELN